MLGMPYLAIRLLDDAGGLSCFFEMLGVPLNSDSALLEGVGNVVFPV